MFGWFKEKRPLTTPHEKMEELLSDFQNQNGRHEKMKWLANLILEARTTKGICYTALEFLNPQDYYRQAIEKLLDKD